MINFKIKVSNIIEINNTDDVVELYSKKLNLRKITDFFDTGEWDMQYVNGSDELVIIKYDGYTIEFNKNLSLTVEYFNESETYVNFKYQYPNTINELISIFKQIGVNVFWSRMIIDRYKPHYLLPKSEIENFIRFNLNNINKGFELL